MKINHQARAAFTLTEVMVSSTIIVVIMGLMMTAVSQTQKTITRTTSKVTQFQAARIAFEAMTRNLSQATLNAYWDLDRDSNTKNPIGYRRQSDLHFVMGKANQPGFWEGQNSTVPSEEIVPTHAVFFQAPLGNSAEERTETYGPNKFTGRRYRSLKNINTVAGYYIKWDKDPRVPKFLSDNGQAGVDYPERYRYRMMEVIQPSENFQVYNTPFYQNLLATPSANPIDPLHWVRTALGIGKINQVNYDDNVTGSPSGSERVENVNARDSSRVLAENVIALLFIPKLSDQDKRAINEPVDDLDYLTTNFEYNTRPLEAFNTLARSATAANLSNAPLNEVQRRQLHQLPPIIQATMIAIDETSADKIDQEEPPKWTNGMFKTLTTRKAFNTELGDLENLDSTSLVYRLQNGHENTPPVNYRVFNTDIVLRGAKWSK